jgi:hypothetical protein
MNYYIVCDEDKTTKWNKKDINICNIVPRIEQVLAQYKTPNGITPKKVGNMEYANFIVRVDDDIPGDRFIEGFSMKSNIKDIIQKKQDKNEYETIKPVLFINFTTANNLDLWEYSLGSFPNNHTVLNLSGYKIGNYDNILQTENKELTKFMKALNPDLKFTPMPTNNWKILYWFLGFVAICLIAFGLYRLYKKYKKQS